MASKKIGALWARKTNDGKSYLSGVLQDLRGDINIAVFKNDRKEKDNQPDYNIVVSERKPQTTNEADDFIDVGEPVNQAPQNEAPQDEINVENLPY